MYSHRLIERAQATALFQTRRNSPTPSSPLDAFSQSAEQDDDGTKRSDESPSEHRGSSFLHTAGSRLLVRRGHMPTAAKIISGFRPGKPPRKLKTLAAAGLCIITAPRANARNAPPGHRSRERRPSV